MRHRLDSSILRAYDIRGEVGVNLNAKDAYAIGIGFASIVGGEGNNAIIIGRDGRHSSPLLAEQLTQGLIDGGMAVIDIGIAPTPMLYFADQILGGAGAIQITGSHNPPPFNGFKFVRKHAPFFDGDLQHLSKILDEGVKKTQGGSYQSHDMSKEYRNALLNYAGDLTPLKDMICVWDCGNGASGAMIASLTAALPGTHHILFADIDGNFPNHHPDPSDPKTLEALREKMRETHADLGFGFDGDGDRLGVIDSKGRHVLGDILTAYLARGILQKHPNAKIVFDIKSSHIALNQVRAAGGAPSLWKSGHSHIKSRLKAENAVMAGEVSGHIFIAQDWYGFDDALLGAVAVLKETSKNDITNFMDSLPTSFATPEWRIPCADDEKFSIIDAIIDGITDAITNADSEILDINTIDGVRVSNQDGWWMIRASNTGAELVARAEGYDEIKRARLCDTLYHWLNATKYGKSAKAIRER